MNLDTNQIINETLNNIHLRRNQLIFLVIDDFKKDIEHISDTLEIPYINVNLELSEMLKDLPMKKRARKVNEFLKKIVKEANSKTVILDHIEILFDPQLMQNPILLFEDISRNYKLIVSWRGQKDNQKLIYSDPEYDDYFTHDNTEGIII